jgi:hypothetical protein
MLPAHSISLMALPAPAQSNLRQARRRHPNAFMHSCMLFPAGYTRQRQPNRPLGPNHQSGAASLDEAGQPYPDPA